MKEEKTPLTILDGFLLLAVVTVGGYIAYRVTGGLHYRWNWSAIPHYLFRYDTETMRLVPNVLMDGLIMTIRLSIWATVIATAVGLMMGLLRVSRSLFGRLVGLTYVECVRNVPPLVLIFIFYYFISDQIFTLVDIESALRSLPQWCLTLFESFCAPVSQCPAFVSAVITLAILEGAYITEIIRAGIQSIDTGQFEAAGALGLSRWQTMRHIILPQAIKIILPPLAGQFISTIKDSAIVSVISIQELTFQGMELMASTYLTFESWITITVLYFVLTGSLSLAVSLLETRLKRTAS